LPITANVFLFIVVKLKATLACSATCPHCYVDQHSLPWPSAMHRLRSSSSETKARLELSVQFVVLLREVLVHTRRKTLTVICTRYCTAAVDKRVRV